ncbi:MAG: GNAT family N-acetyltransferase [Candidatus Berkelbacteria bacterium]|nr:GNAT family N-acetyltransferase [Candidatus Berkelbacteria bacterium]
MQIVEYNKVNKNDWDALVEKSPDGWLYQTSSYINYECKSGNESHSFAVFSDNDELIGLCPLYLGDQFSYSKFIFLRYLQAGCKKYLQPWLNICNLWTYNVLNNGYSGPVISPSLGSKGRKKIFKLIFEHIDKIAQKNRVEALEIRLTDISLSNLPPLRKGGNPLWSVGIAEHLFFPPRLCVILDLQKEESVLLSEMDKDCRAEIKQAERNNLKIKRGVTKKDLRLFHRIHVVSWKRTGVRPQPFEHYTQMWKYLGEEKTIKLFFAEKEKKAVSAVLLHTYKNGVLYWGGCSLPEALSLRANNFLLWSAIKWAKSKGYKWFEIGLFDSFQGVSRKEYSVGQYKAQFSNDYFVPFEGQKLYTKKAVKQLAAISKRNTYGCHR